MGRFRRGALAAAAAAGAGWGAREAWLRSREEDISGQVALVTGSSRGLGFLLARELAREGCKVVICARDEGELERAAAELRREGADVLTVVCDVSERSDVEEMIEDARLRFGGVDILINNAGIIQVGPVHNMTLDDFEQAMDIMYWGTVYPTLAALPHMRRQRYGRIVNITSIGGKVSVPHLLPYSAAKFAAVGFSEGLHSELARDGIKVTTVAPGLMRTGSHLNAYVKGKQEAEAVMFSLAASLPVISMDAERAARQVVTAMKRGQSEIILSLTANTAARVYGLMPGTAQHVLAVVNRFLPKESSTRAGSASVREAQERLPTGAARGLLRGVTGLGMSAAKRFNQHPGPDVPAPDEFSPEVEVVDVPE